MTREEILQAFDDINFVYNDCTKYDTLKRMLEELTERKHGKWLDYEDVENSIYGHVTCLCSICGHVSQYKENYCMHCGSDMRGEEDERNI